MVAKALCFGLALALGAMPPAVAKAQTQNCRIHKATGKCVFVPGAQRVAPDFAVGEVFPVYEHSMLLDIDRYDLPPVSGAWRYYKSGFHIYKVDAGTYRVLDIVKTVRR